MASALPPQALPKQSSTSVNPDTLITVKVAVHGNNRRFKMPLRDLAVNVFADKLFFLLAMDPEEQRNAVIERYSDSASSFVVLDPSNASVYKQLYRAAKAKLKLRLRIVPADATRTNPSQITLVEPAQIAQKQEIKQEKAAEVADAQTAPRNTILVPVAAPVATAPSPTAVAETIQPAESATGESEFHKCLQRLLEDPDYRRNVWNSSTSVMENLLREFESRAFEFGKQLSEVSQVVKDVSDVNVQAITDLATLKTPSVDPSTKIVWSIHCDVCDERIQNTHYHCGVCQNGDYDLCQRCVDIGMHCGNNDHWMIKRTIVGTKVITSTTESRLGPKEKQEAKAPRATPREMAPDVVSAFKTLRVPLFSSQHVVLRSYEDLIEKKHADVSRLTKALEVISQFGFNPLVEDYLKTRAQPETTVRQAATLTRTCNCCVTVLPESMFITCMDCPDYDICVPCLAGARHGHNARHTFKPVDNNLKLNDREVAMLAPGRNLHHSSIYCDGCDQTVRGVRYKCLTCPDWDFCDKCIDTASTSHAGHKFLPVYEPTTYTAYVHASRHLPRHNVFCDGPLCTAEGRGSTITGTRYKCAVCHDTDFCEKCEAHPLNTHNPSHPIIKFKTPVDHVSVTTFGSEDGKPEMQMGDIPQKTESLIDLPLEPVEEAVEAKVAVPSSPTPAPLVPSYSPNTPAVFKSVQSESPLVSLPDVPRLPALPEIPKLYGVMSVAEMNEKLEREMRAVRERMAAAREQLLQTVGDKLGQFVPREASNSEIELQAEYVKDSLADGSKVPADESFKQTWTLRNNGTKIWPAGCSLTFVGGDLLAVDTEGTSNATTCAVLPGWTQDFTITFKAPSKPGKSISYWRLTSPSGHRFGHKIWVDVNVEMESKKILIPVQAPETFAAAIESPKVDLLSTSSNMIFPTLEKESPVSSIHEEKPVAGDDEDLLSEVASVASFPEDDSEDFLTDEEYDILDASDEEFLAEAQKAVKGF